MSSIDSCLAVIEQGAKKGTRCIRPPLGTGGFCGKHQKQLVLKKGEAVNKKKCFKFRCINMIDKNKTYCDICEGEKAEIKKTLKLCIATIQQHDNKGKQCDKVAVNGDYCGKHFERNTMIEMAKKNEERICDDGTRSCKNITKDNKLKCEACLIKTREKENDEYNTRKLTPDMCLGCGKKIEEQVLGFRKEIIKRCKECYEILKATEEKRNRTERDYNREKKLNITRYFDEYIRGAVKRNLLFDLSLEQFENIVSSHCTYCNSFDKDKVIGIDRINSNKGYSLDNVTPCCSVCNIMKNNLTTEEFFSKISTIYKHCIDNKSHEAIVDSLIEEATSYIRPRKILEFYKTGKMNEYYKLCESDSRSPLFLEKIQELGKLKLNERECMAFIQKSLQIDSHFEKKTINCERKRISRKVLWGYLDNNQVTEFIHLYTVVHGEYDGFEEDVKELANEWKTFDGIEKETALVKLLTKYQNLRNR
jgi:hypothetical protein